MWPGCRQHDQGAARGTVLDSAGLRVCFSRRNGVCYSRYCSVTTLSHFVCYSRYHHTATLCLQLLVQPHFVCYCRYHIATLCLLLRVSHCVSCTLDISLTVSGSMRLLFLNNWSALSSTNLLQPHYLVMNCVTISFTLFHVTVL